MTGRKSMTAEFRNADEESEAVLPEDVPVKMPELPLKLVVNTAQQFKAIGEPLRWRILSIIQNQPATAKQIAQRLKVSHGTIGHHLQVLEEAGLARVVARRLVHGIVAKYYTRTARIFMFDVPREVTGDIEMGLQILTDARDEYAESLATIQKGDIFPCSAFPHARLSPERAKAYKERLDALIEDFLQEAPDPDGQIYGLLISIFKSPAYMQGPATVFPAQETADEDETR
jgi:DNA-binding transcriptional ArsR family regulator